MADVEWARAHPWPTVGATSLQITKVTDRWTTCDRKTAICIKVHYTVKTLNSKFKVQHTPLQKYDNCKKTFVDKHTSNTWLTYTVLAVSTRAPTGRNYRASRSNSLGAYSPVSGVLLALIRWQLLLPYCCC